ncbi:ATP-binding protein [Edaphobacter aggregans]|uniref:ATP-binding protein n=1 Tax=Edaphobacter aggregans TaxID=570835 RepID=UPI00069244F9|nr:ATP-binding protein [Edaphobacter aggregans]
MRHLFLKIFLWFWATVILTGISLVLAWVLQPASVPSRWHAGFEDTARYFGTAAAGAFEQSGASAASEYIHRLSEDAHIHACLFDDAGHPLAGEYCPEFEVMTAHIVSGKPSDSDMRRGLARMAVPIKGSNGRAYIYASELLAGPRALGGEHSGMAPLRVVVALLVSGAICYFLTLYLTTPILRLRSAAQQIAAGELSVRAEPSMELRRDELGDLVRDFNRMADKTEHLISSQRQLLYDVSHELRSPLARMNVALDLLRGRVRDDPALDRLETDLQRLNQMIGRLLTVAKLEAASTLQTPVRVDLSELISSVVSDADFEAQERGSRVDIVQAANPAVLGDPNLLRSAVENVLRNAIRFTQTGTAVEVALRTDGVTSENEVILSIRDHGPGVPEQELSNIFKPFYRVADTRSYDPGGVGLGLAITERIVRLHGGRIQAINDPNGGLRVEMIFPRAFWTAE